MSGICSMTPATIRLVQNSIRMGIIVADGCTSTRLESIQFTNICPDRVIFVDQHLPLVAHILLMLTLKLPVRTEMHFLRHEWRTFGSRRHLIGGVACHHHGGELLYSARRDGRQAIGQEDMRSIRRQQIHRRH